MKSEHPGLSIGEVAKKLGELWNNTSSEDKQPYEKKASKLKEKYEKVRPWTPAQLRLRSSVWGAPSSSLTCSPCPPQDVAAYRQKTKGGSGSGKAPAKAEKKADDDDDDEDEEEDEEEDDDDDDDE